MKKATLVLAAFLLLTAFSGANLPAEEFTFEVSSSDVYNALRVKWNLEEMAVNYVYLSADSNQYDSVVTGWATPDGWNGSVPYPIDYPFALGCAEVSGDGYWRVITDNPNVAGRVYGSAEGVGAPLQEQGPYWLLTIQSDDIQNGQEVLIVINTFGYLLDPDGVRGPQWSGGRDGSFMKTAYVSFGEGDLIPIEGGKVIEEDGAGVYLNPGSLAAPTSWTIDPKEEPLPDTVLPGVTPISYPYEFTLSDNENYLGGATIQLPLTTDLCGMTIPEGQVVVFECKEYFSSGLGVGCGVYSAAFDSPGTIIRSQGRCVAVFEEIPHFSVYFAALINEPGDLNGDGYVDRNDLQYILDARNQPADDETYGPGRDPRDLDGDGFITVLDARKLTLLCTCPRCVCLPPE